MVANDSSGKKREEVFVDIIEKISVTFNASVSTNISIICSVLVPFHLQIDEQSCSIIVPLKSIPCDYVLKFQRMYVILF